MFRGVYLKSEGTIEIPLDFVLRTYYAAVARILDSKSLVALLHFMDRQIGSLSRN
jgi:hypothetical protein